ncbi:S-layer homology domain-containing protein [Paenibacillus aquistagni]|nr:S-layer homology domain-containing protein [Paenibacillus aquistagni]
MRKFISMMLVMVIIVAMVPLPFAGQAYADSVKAGSNFVFNNESTSISSARVTRDAVTSFTGTLNGVSGSNISYSVYNVTNNDRVIDDNYREGITSNINANDGRITVNNIQLYPGLNRIVFTGYQGITVIQETFYVEYRNGPTLHDLEISLSGNTFPIAENEVTVVYSSTTKGATEANVTIKGVAPNSDKVQVIVNGNSKTYNVTESAGWRFFSSSTKLMLGKNIITFKVYNGTQVVETTREVAFYNQKVTYFDVSMKDQNNNKVDLSQSPTLVASSPEVTGRIIMPIDNTVTVPPTVDVKYKLDNGTEAPVTATRNASLATSHYEVYEFTLNLTGTQFDKRHELALKVDPFIPDPADIRQGEKSFYFTLKNASEPYIYQARYLQGYSSGMTVGEVLNLQGVTLNGSDIYSLPAAIEFLVVNGDVNNAANLIQIDSIVGLPSTTGAELTFLNGAATTEQVMVNGVSMSMTKVVYTLNKLPKTGKLTLNLKANGSTSLFPATITLLYGPYVKFNEVYDGMKISQSTPGLDMFTAAKQIVEDLDFFNGEIYNVANESNIVYSGTGQNVFFYINNKQIPLKPGSRNSQFGLDQANQNIIDEAARALTIGGDNKVKFVYRTDNQSYEATMTFTIISSGAPSIPAVDTDPIYPYITKQEPHDPAITEKGGIYYTSETSFNVFGTFDFIDLGKDQGTVEATLSGMSPDELASFMFQIRMPNMTKPITWTLGNDLYQWKGSSVPYNGTNNPVDNLKVYYDEEKQSFIFVIEDIQLPVDGTPLNMRFKVSNNGGITGPEYPMQVIRLVDVYNLIKPIPEKRVVNQNFVEIVLQSENADKVTINKKEVPKSTYKPFYVDDIVYENAYRTIVTGLKANKDTKIDIVINVGNDVIKDTIIVKYVPTIIPGAVNIEDMSKSFKLFEGKLNLSFDKGTSLVRRNYNEADPLYNQIYADNMIYFAIANPKDGIVDRFEFEAVPANYDDEMAEAGVIFDSSFPKQYVKMSEVFWMDPGLADDIGTPTVYDPIKEGHNPVQMSSNEKGIESYHKRMIDRELVPSKRGKLTLGYNPSTIQDTGRMITVLRFNPEMGQWENLGGVVDPKKHTVTVPFDQFGYYVVAKLSFSYEDIVDHNYGRDFIETIYAKGVMNASVPNSYFGTGEYITRGEFTRIIVKGMEFKLNYDGQLHFDDLYIPPVIDVNATWDYRYIETAARLGIVRGVAPNYFGGDLQITRQDAAVMVAKALNLKLETDPDKVLKGLQKYFRDASKINYYARPSVLAIAKKGLLAGVPVDPNDPSRGAVFNPDANMLRGDAAILMARVMIDAKKLPKM